MRSRRSACSSVSARACSSAALGPLFTLGAFGRSGSVSFCFGLSAPFRLQTENTESINFEKNFVRASEDGSLTSKLQNGYASNMSDKFSSSITQEKLLEQVQVTGIIQTHGSETSVLQKCHRQLQLRNQIVQCSYTAMVSMLVDIQMTAKQCQCIFIQLLCCHW